MPMAGMFGGSVEVWLKCVGSLHRKFGSLSGDIPVKVPSGEGVRAHKADCGSFRHVLCIPGKTLSEHPGVFNRNTTVSRSDGVLDRLFALWARTIDPYSASHG